MAYAFNKTNQPEPMGPVKAALITALSSAVLIAVFVGCNVLAASLPQDQLMERVEESSSFFLFENVYNYDHRVLGSYVSYDNNRYIQYIALQDNLGSPFDTSMVASIDDYYQGKHFHWQYFRYWHGWQLLTDMLLLAGGGMVLCAGAFILGIASCIFMFFALRKYLKSFPAAVFVVVSAFSTNILGNFMGDILLQFSISSIYLMGAAILFVGVSCSVHRGFYVKLLTFLAGCVFCYLDFFTVPAFACAMIVFCYMLASDFKDVPWKQRIVNFLTGSMLFGLGFVLTWIIKWVLVGLVLGIPFVFNNVFAEANLWTVDAYEVDGGRAKDIFKDLPQLFALKESIAAVYRTPAGKGWIAFTGLTVIAAVVKAIICKIKYRFKNSSQKFELRKKDKSNPSLIDCVFFTAPSLFVIALPIVMSRHIIHHLNIFGYKSWAFVLAVVTALSLHYLLTSFNKTIHCER